ncbi:hypothetical protein BGZ47_004553 [Haplosporangium gracile]|nr:hypothetical protein BGZ47_004553 [Haplosporangium gracile]
MPEPTVATIAPDAITPTVATADIAVTAKPGQLMADASPEPTMTMDDFMAKANDYYSWPYTQRARVMGCPSTFHLCKTLIFENTKYKQDESKPLDEDRYWCIIVQYEGAVNITKLEKAVREKTGATRKATHMRIAPADKSLELTGFKQGGVCPVGMRTDLPILVSKELAELSPRMFYLGAGHLDWKIAVPFEGFVEKWNTRVVDFS